MSGSLILPAEMPTAEVMELLKSCLVIEDGLNAQRAINTLAIRRRPDGLMWVLIGHDTVKLDAFAGELGRSLISTLHLGQQTSQAEMAPTAYIGLRVIKSWHLYTEGKRERDFFSVKRDVLQPIAAVAELLNKIGGNVNTLVDDHVDLLMNLGLDEDGVIAAHDLLADGLIDSVVALPTVGGPIHINIDAGKLSLMIDKDTLFDN